MSGLVTGAMALVAVLLAIAGAFAAIAYYGHGQRELQTRARRQTIRSTAAALKGEILAARAQYDRFLETLRAFKGTVEKRAGDPELADKPSDMDLRRWIPPVSDRIFLAVAGDLGLLGSQMAFDIADLYARFANLAESRHVAVPAPNRAMPTILDGLIGDLETNMKRIDLVIRSLEELERSEGVASSG